MIDPAFVARCAGSFVLTLIATTCWALYFRYSSEKKPVKAAFADCGIVAAGMVNIVGYTEDHRLAVPIMLATFVGTVYMISHKKA